MQQIAPSDMPFYIHNGPPGRLTEAAHAERFAVAIRDEFRYDHRRGSWLYYGEPIWRPDVDGAIYRRAIQFVREYETASTTIPDQEARANAVKFALRSESKAAIDRLVDFARHLHPIADSGDNWDIDPWLLGAVNGIVDLRTGELRAGLPQDRISMTCGVAYDPQAKCPRWLHWDSQPCLDQAA